jgi:hypothetical protein
MGRHRKIEFLPLIRYLVASFGPLQQSNFFLNERNPSAGENTLDSDLSIGWNMELEEAAGATNWVKVKIPRRRRTIAGLWE